MAVFVVGTSWKQLHWDFRLEIRQRPEIVGGAEGPRSIAQKAVGHPACDHGLEQGTTRIIPEGMYGAGPVLIWDKGTFEMTGGESASDGLRGGTLTFELHGKILKGVFTLIRMGSRCRAESWLLIKKADTRAERGWLTPVLLTPARRKKLKERRPPCAPKES
jgi:bifunctional non-homologous end joining protein LigD